MSTTTLHYSNNRLLLQNITTNLWHYISLVTDNGQVRVKINQTGLTYAGTPYSQYAVMVDQNGIYWKFGLKTNNEGVVTYSVDRLTTPLPVTSVVLKADDNLYYAILIVANGVQSYPQITPVSEVASSIGLPWRPIVAVDFLTKSTVLTSTEDAVPVNP